MPDDWRDREIDWPFTLCWIVGILGCCAVWVAAVWAVLHWLGVAS